MTPVMPCVWFTGLPAAGKTTLARSVAALLEPLGVTTQVLDGDDVRAAFGHDLGYSPADRRLSAERLVRLALDALDDARIPLVAAVSPFRSDRAEARAVLEQRSVFFEVHVHAPITECIRRDPKGLYARARRGEISGLTGIDDPYEPPQWPEVLVRTDQESPRESAAQVFAALSPMLAKGPWAAV